MKTEWHRYWNINIYYSLHQVHQRVRKTIYIIYFMLKYTAYFRMSQTWRWRHRTSTVLQWRSLRRGHIRTMVILVVHGRQPATQCGTRLLQFQIIIDEIVFFKIFLSTWLNVVVNFFSNLRDLCICTEISTAMTQADSSLHSFQVGKTPNAIESSQWASNWQLTVSKH